MKLELVWFLLPLASMLWAAGGTWNKLFRRAGIPISVFLACLVFLGFSWWLPLITLPYFLVTILPFTLVDDSVPSHWVNWVWIWVWALLIGLASLGIGILTGFVGESLFSSLVMLIPALCCTLSNVRATAKYFPWKLCEATTGFFSVIPVATLIQLGG
jgi:hypothetical protein